jgi:hypothetical protein
MTTTLRQRAEDYLRLRRALGFKLVNTEILLMQFVSHLGAWRVFIRRELIKDLGGSL